MKSTLQQIGRLWNSGGKTAKRWGRKNPAVLHAQRYPKDIKNILYSHVLARQASATPPLGPTLGQFGIPIIKFCDQFNSVSYKFKRSIKLCVVLYQTYDNDFYFDICLPMTSVSPKRVARMYKGSGQAGQVYSKQHLVELVEKKKIEDALRLIELASPTRARDEKYAELDPRVKKPSRNKSRRKQGKAKRKSYLTKHQNVVGSTRFIGITPQMLYEVCLMKYIQYLNGGVYAFNMREFDMRYARSLAHTDVEKDGTVLEPRNMSLEAKYIRVLRSSEASDSSTSVAGSSVRVNPVVMRSLFRLCRGTMRSMGLSLVPDGHIRGDLMDSI